MPLTRTLWPSGPHHSLGSVIPLWNSLPTLPNADLNHTHIKGRYFRSHMYLPLGDSSAPMRKNMREAESSCLEAPRCPTKYLSCLLGSPLISVYQTNDGDQLPTVSEASKNGFWSGWWWERIFAHVSRYTYREPKEPLQYNSILQSSLH